MSKTFYIETYGCQMNFADSEIVAKILSEIDYIQTSEAKNANLILINTCSIRENAEQRVLNRLNEIVSYKKQNKNLLIGIIGCMAERLKERLFEINDKIDLLAGPDSYKKLPDLLKNISLTQQQSIDVLLSNNETYDDILPFRYQTNGISAFISIMRGCENFCSYCVVPYTRGKERSRDGASIINEIDVLIKKDYKEITLLGQNVNSYLGQYNNITINFAQLLELIAQKYPQLRIRFATSHPKDLSDDLIQVISKYQNICKSFHLPLQSGSNNMLNRMNRKYTKEWYLERVSKLKHQIPEISITTDIIAGFCGETEQDHQDTLSVMKLVEYDFAYMFKYSERENTYAWKKYNDDVPEDVKIKRLNEIINLQNELSLKSNKKNINCIFEVLVEGQSKKSSSQLSGRTSQNKVVIFPKKNYKKGDLVQVEITDCTSATLFGKVIND